MRYTGAFWHIFAISAILCFSCACGGCMEAGEPENSSRLVVSVTLAAQEELVRSVGGDRVDVVVLLPGYADPHSFEPQASQMVNVSRSDLYFRIGEGLLPFEDRVVSRLEGISGDLLVVDTSEGIELISDPEGGEADPHIWLSLRNAGMMVDTICEALVSRDPSGGEYYSANRDAYRARLDSLDNEMANDFSEVRTRVFIVMHPAWGYFARDYNLTQLYIQAGGKEATAQDLKDIIAVARAENIDTIFAEPQFSTRGAEMVAREIDGRVELLDPMAPGYLANMELAGEKIRRSLQE